VGKHSRQAETGGQFVNAQHEVVSHCDPDCGETPYEGDPGVVAERPHSGPLSYSGKGYASVRFLVATSPPFATHIHGAVRPYFRSPKPAGAVADRQHETQPLQNAGLRDFQSPYETFIFAPTSGGTPGENWMASLQDFDQEIAKTKQVVEEVRSKIEHSGTMLEAGQGRPEDRRRQFRHRKCPHRGCAEAAEGDGRQHRRPDHRPRRRHERLRPNSKT
jgi:hypothetical protein